MQPKLFLKKTLTVVMSLLLAAAAIAATPLKLNHQGYLLDGADTPLDGVVSITYGIYDSPTGGVALWSESHPSVTVVAGLFTSTLGSVVPLSSEILSPPSSLPGGGPARYLEIVVNGVAIVPRSELVATPYSVASSRLSGDVETMPGGMTATNQADALDVTVNASDPASQLSISQGGTKRFGVGVEQPTSPLGVRMVLGDLDRDGLMDVVVADGASSMTLVDSTGSGGTVISSSVSSGLALQPLGGNILIHSADATGASRSSVECSPDSAVSSMSTTNSGVINNLRTRIDALEARLMIESDPNGDAKSSANIAALLNGNVVIDCVTDSDGDGQPEGRVNSLVSLDGSASHETSSRSASGLQARTGEYVGGSGTLSRSYCDIDLDGDGISEYSAWQKVDNTEVITATTVDIDDDGTPDVGTEVSALVPRTVLKSYFQSADKPTASQFLVVSDSSGSTSTVEVDLNHDDNPEGSSSMEAKETRTELKTKFQDGDVPTEANLVVTSSDADGAGTSMRAPTALLTWGTGLAFRVDATGPAIRMDQDSLPTFTVESNPSSTEMRLQKAIADGDTKLEMSASSSDCRLALGDLNGDGFAELTTSSSSTLPVPQYSKFQLGRPAHNVATITTDAFSSSMTLAHASTGPGDKPTSADFGNMIDSYVHLNDDGITRFSATSTSGVQLRDQFNNPTTSLSTDGIAFFGAKVGIGVAAPTAALEVAGGAYCDGTNWVNASDRNSKENFKEVDGEELLGKIADLEITRWNYKNDKATAHIGPTAQDFKEKFGVGSDGKSISTIDPSGIALAAIKELNKQNCELRDQNKDLKKELDELKRLVKQIALKK